MLKLLYVYWGFFKQVLNIKEFKGKNKFFLGKIKCETNRKGVYGIQESRSQVNAKNGPNTLFWEYESQIWKWVQILYHYFIS